MCGGKDSWGVHRTKLLLQRLHHNPFERPWINCRACLNYSSPSPDLLLVLSSSVCSLFYRFPWRRTVHLFAQTTLHYYLLSPASRVITTATFFPSPPPPPSMTFQQFRRERASSDKAQAAVPTSTAKRPSLPSRTNSAPVGALFQLDPSKLTTSASQNVGNQTVVEEDQSPSMSSGTPTMPPRVGDEVCPFPSVYRWISMVYRLNHGALSHYPNRIFPM